MTAAQEFVPSYITPQPGELDSLQRIGEAITDALASLDAEVLLHLEQNPDPEAAILLLRDLRALIDPFKDLVAAVETTAAQRMPRKKMQVGDLAVERTGGIKRQAWQHDRLAWACISDLAVDSNGEFDDAASALIGAVRDRIVNAAGIQYWRTTQLALLGVNADDYCEKVEAAHHIKLTPILEVEA